MLVTAAAVVVTVVAAATVAVGVAAAAPSKLTRRSRYQAPFCRLPREAVSKTTPSELSVHKRV